LSRIKNEKYILKFVFKGKKIGTRVPNFLTKGKIGILREREKNSKK
jgi:hypothetical protein